MAIINKNQQIEQPASRVTAVKTKYGTAYIVEGDGPVNLPGVQVGDTVVQSGLKRIVRAAGKGLELWLVE